jgi:hypothetical protein
MRAPPTLATRRGFLATSAAAGAITLLTLQSDESIEICADTGTPSGRHRL